MKKRFVIVLCFLAISQALAFDNEISYIGIDVKDPTDVLFNGTYSISSYLFYDSSCQGDPDATSTSSLDILNGNMKVSLNYTLASTNRTFYIKPSIAGTNQTCFKYTMAAQAERTDYASDSDKVDGYHAAGLPIAGHVTGTLASSVVASLALDSITYTGLLGFNNLTKCSGTEILKMSGGSWTCDSDSTGSDTTCDTVACSFSDDTLALDTLAYTGLLGHNNLTKCTDTQILKMSGSSWTCAADATGSSAETDPQVGLVTSGKWCIGNGTGLNCNVDPVVDTDTDTDTNNYTTSIQVTGTTTKNLSLARNGLINISATWTDLDTDTTCNGVACTFSDDTLALDTLAYTGLLGHNNLTKCSDTQILKMSGASWACAADATGGAGTDTNTNVTAIQVTGTTSKTFSLEQPNLANLTASWTDMDTDTNANTICSGTTTYLDGEGNCDDISSVYYLATNPSSYITAAQVPAAETDSAHDSCAEITGCVVGAITSVASDSTWTLHDSYPASCSAGQYVSGLGDTLTCSTPVDLNNYTTSIQVTGTTTKNLSLARNGLVNISATWTDIDTDTNANTICSGSTTYLDGEGNCDDISSVYYDSESDLTTLLNDNYADVAGDTFTGNVVMNQNLTVENILLENDVVNHMIYDNTTCVLIRGDTAIIEVC